MKNLKFLWISLIQTLLRMAPFPCKTGLIRIGNPGPDSPVLLTCNFRLTVERVRRALEGMDAYLLVANSRGINVWCAATGGLLTNHNVVSVLKTSGIEDLVAHRQVILPQLAATGVEGQVIRHKTGWNVVWGPVYATSIPAFLSGGLEKSQAMSEVSFPWPQRLEMALAWAFPLSLLALLVFPFWRAGVLPLVGLVWGLSLLIFLSFPLYEKWLHTTGQDVGFVFFQFGEHGIPLLLWLLFLVGLVGYAALTDHMSWAFLLHWGLISLILLLVLGMDLAGSTPLYKSGLHKERLLHISLDEERCSGDGVCQEVCPRSVFEVDESRGLTTLPRAEACVHCGACIVQCPCDALSFQSPTGEAVTPEIIRKYKLNLMGSRQVKSERG